MTRNNNRSSKTILDSKLKCCALIGATALLCTTAAMARADSARFDIAAQPIPTALKAFAAQAHMQLLYEYGAVANASGNAVSGDLDKHIALAQLLQGTGLEVIYSSTTTATIRAANEATSSAEAGMREPDRMQVAQAAQGSPKSKASDYLAKFSLEEVIVTARRREERVQTVPIAITVLSQEKLQNNNITTVENLQHAVPSLGGTSSVTRDAFNPSLRGQTVSNGRPGVNMYLNEVPIPTDVSSGGQIAGGPGLLFDLENVQVLKGPQGTLFGRESVGGSILLQSARPKNDFGGRIQLGYGNYKNREIDAAINIPIVDDTLLTRLAFNGQKRDGFTWVQSTPNHPNGIDADNRDHWSVRGSVTFKPSDRFENDTVATYQHFQTNGTAAFLTGVNPARANFLGSLEGIFIGNVGFTTLPSLLAQQQALDIRTHTPLDTPIESSGTMLAISNVTNIQMSEDLKLRTILGYDRVTTTRVFDLDGTSLPIIDEPRSPSTYVQRQYTAEVQLLGRSFGERLDWVAGGFALNIPFEDYALKRGKQLGLVNDSKQKSRTTSRALYGQGTYDLSALANGLKATAGLRYTWDRKTDSLIYGSLGTNCDSIPTVRCDDSNATRTHAESSALTWSTGLDYQVAPQTLLYLASRRGYRAGGINDPVAGVVAPKYDPEYVLDYELGVKSDWHVGERNIRTNLDVFLQDYEDIQVSRNVQIATGGNQTFTDNAAKARLWGGELEALIELTDDLELGASASYLNMEFTEFAQGVQPGTIADLRVKENSNPNWKYGLSSRYRLPLNRQMGELSLQVNWNWQAKFIIGSDSSGTYEIPAYSLLNLAINWDHIASGPIDASFFMSNVTNEEYIIGGISVEKGLAFRNTVYGEPRMYGVRARWRFGAE